MLALAPPTAATSSSALAGKRFQTLRSVTFVTFASGDSTARKTLPNPPFLAKRTPVRRAMLPEEGAGLTPERPFRIIRESSEANPIRMPRPAIGRRGFLAKTAGNNRLA